MASKTKIYIVLELVDGGELFDKIVSLIYFSFSFRFVNVLASDYIHASLISRLQRGNLKKMKLEIISNNLLMLLTTAIVEACITEI